MSRVCLWAFFARLPQELIDSALTTRLNLIAKMYAPLVALLWPHQVPKVPVTLRTDSSNTIGACLHSMTFGPMSRLPELLCLVLQCLPHHSYVEFSHVAGHSGDAANEFADSLAALAALDVISPEPSSAVAVFFPCARS